MKFKKICTIIALFLLGIQTILPVVQVLTVEAIEQIPTITREMKSENSSIKSDEEKTTESTINTKMSENIDQSEEDMDIVKGETNAPIGKSEGESNRLYSENELSYTLLVGNETDEIKEELLNFMNTHIQEIQAIRGASFNAHVGYTASNANLYEFIPVDSPMYLRDSLQERAGITISIVQQFNVNWHIRMPASGLETWGSVYDQMATPDGKPLFCIEPGILVNGIDGYTQTVVPSQITTRMKQGATIGFTQNRDIAHYWNTQTFLWDELGVQWIENSGRNQTIQNEINTGISNLSKRPSFNNQQVTLKVGESITLTDSNGVFKDYAKMSSNTSGVKVEHKGNQLKITATSDSKEDGKISFQRYNLEPINIAYVKPGSQAIAVLHDPDMARINIPVKVIKSGHAQVKKIDKTTGAPLAGAVFKFTNLSTNETKEITSNAQGIAQWNDLLAETKVKIEEIKAPNGYVLNKTAQTVTIKPNETVSVTLDNKEQVGKITLYKEDKETGKQPQGSATLEGAVYGLFETNGKKIKEVTLKKSGEKVTGSFENIKIMHDYYVQEVKAPNGYNLDNTKYPVNLAYAGQDKEIALKELTVKDQVIKGGIELIKIGNKPLIPTTSLDILADRSNIKPPLEGVEFTVTSKTTKKPVTVLTTDKEGKAATGKILPYDSYILTETKPPAGYLPIEPVEFTISEEDQKFFWVLENKIIEAQLHLVKVDAETGERIPMRDTSFKIWDTWANEGEGAYVTMRVPNSLETSDTFKTNEQGGFVTTDSLAYGVDRYQLREVRAPDGYLLATEPLIFSVTEKDAGEIITILFKNTPQKGQVKLHKTGEMGLSFTETESEYGQITEIQFGQQDLANAEFTIRAREEIKTPDGTVRLEKGEYVQKDGEMLVLKTNEFGEALSEPNLYIGQYEFVEISAPNGFVLIKEPIPFDIEYEGQLVEVSSTTVSIENKLQAFNVYGYKKQEVITDWTEGEPIIDLEDAKNGQVFGLFVGESGLAIGDQLLPEGTALGYSEVEDGIVAFEAMKLPNQEVDLYLQEVYAGKDHVLDPTKYMFQYVPSTNEQAHTLHVFSDKTLVNKEIHTKIERKEIVNPLAKASVELTKVDNLGNKPLEGVSFDLIRLEEDQEIFIASYKTDKDGKITIKDLPTGNYVFKETKPLQYYNPNNEDLHFEIAPDTDGTTLTLKAINERQPLLITTLLATVDGKKEINPHVDNILRDKVSIKRAEKGHIYYVESAYVDPQTKKVLAKDQSTYTAKNESDTFFVDFKLKKDTMKDGQKGVATHYIYYDKEKTKLVGEETDLTNMDQTVVAKAPKPLLPKAGTSNNVWLTVCGFILLAGAFVLYFINKKTKNIT
ncbi:TPA: SpaA isopeptide-forming pilin-related protein [Enterococcus faecalis]